MAARSKTLIAFTVIVGTQCVAADNVMQPRECATAGVSLQVLGGGGPEFTDQHASSGYIIWKDGAARILVDLGGGAEFRFEQSAARFADLDAIAFTHLHADHSAGLPALIKASYFVNRERDLPVYGPSGNKLVSSPSNFLTKLFGSPDGVYPYLSNYVTANSGTYNLKPIDIDTNNNELAREVLSHGITLTAVPVQHGPIPALAWRVDVENVSITITGDMNGNTGNLEKLARDSDLLVAHNAIPEGATGIARKLHMPPSVIGQIASRANVGRVVLSHRMTRTFGNEDATRAEIAHHYAGPVTFAEDLDCYRVSDDIKTSSPDG